jgi:hypothetical protein
MYVSFQLVHQMGISLMFAQTPGYERIPENWYRRAIGDEYTIPYFSLDLNTAALTYPQFLSIGGNTGKTNTFTPVDVLNLTGGVFSTGQLLEGNNLACFGFQAAQQAAPDLLKGVLSDVAGALAQVASAIAPILSEMNCPQLETIDESQFKQFPGFSLLSSTGTYSK